MNRNRPRQLFKPSKFKAAMPAELQFAGNPEDNATSDLLKISNEDLSFDSIQYFKGKELELERQIPQEVQTPLRFKSKQPKTARVSVADNFTECFKRYRRPSVHELSNMDLANGCRKNAINPSYFLILCGDNYDNLHVVDPKLQVSNSYRDKMSQKLRQSKHFSSLARKRNKSFIKQYLQNQSYRGPKGTNDPDKGQMKQVIQKISKSCQLKGKQHVQPPSPILIVSPSKMDTEHCFQLRCTSPTFKNKKVNYRQIRYANIREEISLINKKERK